MLQGRGVRALWGTGVLLTAVWACETARNPGGIQRDLTPPTISLTKAPPDTQDISAGLTFSVSATDNLGLKDIRLTYTGGYIALTDTVFFSTVTASSIPVHITFPSGSGAGGLIRIVGRATDGAGNFTEDTLFIFLKNVQALRVTLLAPLTGAWRASGNTSRSASAGCRCRESGASGGSSHRGRPPLTATRSSTRGRRSRTRWTSWTPCSSRGRADSSPWPGSPWIPGSASPARHRSRSTSCRW